MGFCESEVCENGRRGREGFVFGFKYKNLLRKSEIVRGGNSFCFVSF